MTTEGDYASATVQIMSCVSKRHVSATAAALCHRQRAAILQCGMLQLHMWFLHVRRRSTFLGPSLTHPTTDSNVFLPAFAQQSPVLVPFSLIARSHAVFVCTFSRLQSASIEPCMGVTVQSSFSFVLCQPDAIWTKPLVCWCRRFVDLVFPWTLHLSYQFSR